MPVATVPAYDEMWVHPAVVAALSGGIFTYTEVPGWDPAADYPRGAHVLSCDAPYGYVYTATAAIPAGAAGPGDNPAWVLDQQLTQQRLSLFTATTSATWLLDTLTGYRLHGIECWSEDYQVHTCTIRLRRSPVTAIHSVTRVHRCNQPIGEVADWCQTGAGTVSLCCNGYGQPWPYYSLADPYAYSGYGTPGRYGCGCGETARIVYTIGSNLPPGTESVVAWLATEYGKAASGVACALPERITSVSRQGVSWTVLDPQEYLSRGFTGMSRVDNWLAAVKRTIGGTLIDPLTSTVVFSTLVDCPPAVTPVGV